MMLKIWTEDDKTSQATNNWVQSRKVRQVIFVSSAAAFVGFPGYIAYTRMSTIRPRYNKSIFIPANSWSLKATKCAERALADILRAEALRYSCPASKYTAHCAFPSNLMSPAFVYEQKSKPELTKRMEGTAASTLELAGKLHSSEQAAYYIITAVGRSDFAICSELEAAVFFSNMIGPLPMRGFGFWILSWRCWWGFSFGRFWDVSSTQCAPKMVQP